MMGLPAARTAETNGAARLDALASGKRARVARVRGEGELRRRLLEMGLCAGVEVDVLRRAPFGDPIEVRVRGYLLSLRADEARLVEVVPAS